MDLNLESDSDSDSENAETETETEAETRLLTIRWISERCMFKVAFGVWI